VCGDLSGLLYSHKVVGFPINQREIEKIAIFEILTSGLFKEKPFGM